MFYPPDLIDQQGARRNEERAGMLAGDDVHFAGHAGHQILGRIFEVEDDGVTLRFGIGGGQDGGDFGVELAGPKGIDLQDGFHADLHFADVFFVHFAAHIISS